MFFDETKRAMVSVEQHIEVPSADYLAEQKLFDADAMELMARHGLGVVRLDHHAPEFRRRVDYRVDPTIISTDIESVRLGKDLGASRAVELLAAQGITPQAWRTVGDSRTDYAMADWLHHNDHAGQACGRPARGRRPGETVRRSSRPRTWAWVRTSSTTTPAALSCAAGGRRWAAEPAAAGPRAVLARSGKHLLFPRADYHAGRNATLPARRQPLQKQRFRTRSTTADRPPSRNNSMRKSLRPTAAAAPQAPPRRGPAQGPLRPDQPAPGRRTRPWSRTCSSCATCWPTPGWPTCWSAATTTGPSSPWTGKTGRSCGRPWWRPAADEPFYSMTVDAKKKTSVLVADGELSTNRQARIFRLYRPRVEPVGRLRVRRVGRRAD